MTMAAGSDLRLAAPSCQLDWGSNSGDDSRRNSAARFAVSAFPAAAVDSLVFVLVSAVDVVAAVSTAYYPACFVPNWPAVLERKPVRPALHTARSTIPRIGVSVSFPFTLFDSNSHRWCHPPAPAAANRSVAKNPKLHHNFPAPSYSG